MKPITLAMLVALAFPAPTLAHHGWAGQDNGQATILEGRITAVRYRNPHGEIDLEVDGRRWLITLAPIQRMQTRGVTEASLKPGRSVRIEGARNLDPKRFEVKAASITIAGKTTGLR